MSFPKKGKFFPTKNGYADRGWSEDESDFAAAIAAALNRSLGPTRAGAKTASAWTGANEKTVKNWFSGRYGPSGQHLVALARHSHVAAPCPRGESGTVCILGCESACKTDPLGWVMSD